MVAGLEGRFVDKGFVHRAVIPEVALGGGLGGGLVVRVAVTGIEIQSRMGVEQAGETKLQGGIGIKPARGIAFIRVLITAGARTHIAEPVGRLRVDTKVHAELPVRKQVAAVLEIIAGKAADTQVETGHIVLAEGGTVRFVSGFERAGQDVEGKSQGRMFRDEPAETRFNAQSEIAGFVAVTLGGGPGVAVVGFPGIIVNAAYRGARDPVAFFELCEERKACKKQVQNA